MNEKLFEIAKHFVLDGAVMKIEPFGNGHINDTYRVTTKESEVPDYILQRKNHQVFKDIPGMMENIIRVTDHIRKKLVEQDVRDIEKRVIQHIKTNNGDYLYKDKEGNFWTVFLLIKGSHSVENIENPDHAFLAGKGFGRFQKQLKDLPGKPLNETIIDFHNIEFRYRNFRNSLTVNYQNRKELCKKEIDFVLEKEEEMHTLIKAERNGEIPSRITHNDTKINNILFDNFGQILCVIDLDTVMPGLVHFDFGDAIRTAANTAEEDEPELDKITINLQIFEAFAKGFLEETKSFLTQKEIDLIPHSAKFMTFIMGLRFLTDYLDGDVYYKIEHSEHNIQRCRAQFKLVKEIGKNEEEMKSIIAKLA
jgi:Ser/Thr protein kinase RdoA (MazF antagonist)